METYKIIRFKFKGGNKIIKTGLTLDEAQKHCNDESTHGEGCLSIPSIHIDTIRYEKILYINNGVENIADGLLSIAIQHEIDHVFGLTILNKKWRSR